MGPSSLLRLTLDPTPAMAVTQPEFCPFIGPVHAAVTIDMVGAGRDTIVAAAGCGRDSKLAIGTVGFRTDVLADGLRVDGRPDIYLFSLSQSKSQYVVLSYAIHDRSSLFTLDLDGDSGTLDLTPSSILGTQLLPQRSLLVAQIAVDVSGDLLLQVTPGEARVVLGPGVDDEPTCRGSVGPPDGIRFTIAATGVSQGQTFVALTTGRTIELYAVVLHQQFVMSLVWRIDTRHEVSALTVASVGLLVGYWISDSVDLISFDRSHIKVWSTVRLGAPPRSVMHYSVGQRSSYLLAGLSNGQLVSIAIHNARLSEPVFHAVGRSDVAIHSAPQHQGRYLACSDRSSVVTIGDSVSVVPLSGLDGAAALTHIGADIRTSTAVTNRRKMAELMAFRPEARLMKDGGRPTYPVLPPMVEVAKNGAVMVVQPRLMLGVAWRAVKSPEIVDVQYDAFSDTIFTLVHVGKCYQVRGHGVGDGLEVIGTHSFAPQVEVTAVSPTVIDGRTFLLVAAVDIVETGVADDSTLPRVDVLEWGRPFGGATLVGFIPVDDVSTAIAAAGDRVVIAVNRDVIDCKLVFIDTDSELGVKTRSIGGSNAIAGGVVAVSQGGVESYLGSTVTGLTIDPSTGDVTVIEVSGTLSVLRRTDGQLMARSVWIPRDSCAMLAAPLPDGALVGTDAGELCIVARDEQLGSGGLPRRPRRRQGGMHPEDSDTDGELDTAGDRPTATRLRSVSGLRSRHLASVLTCGPSNGDGPVWYVLGPSGSVAGVTLLPPARYRMMGQLQGAGHALLNKGMATAYSITTPAQPAEPCSAVDGDIVARLQCAPRSEFESITRRCNVSCDQVRLIVSKSEMTFCG